MEKEICAEINYGFVYVEQDFTNFLNDEHHLPLRPFLEVSLFSLCKKKNIPICLFYRDIYWLFPEYRELLIFYKRFYAQVFYFLELFLFKKYVDIIYVPSLKMAEYIPIIPRHNFKELPPGCEVKYPKVNLREDKLYFKANYKLTLIYVGGIGIHYQMHELFKAICKIPEVRLVLCTREDE